MVYVPLGTDSITSSDSFSVNRHVIVSGTVFVSIDNSTAMVPVSLLVSVWNEGQNSVGAEDGATVGDNVGQDLHVTGHSSRPNPVVTFPDIVS